MQIEWSRLHHNIIHFIKAFLGIHVMDKLYKNTLLLTAQILGTGEKVKILNENW